MEEKKSRFWELFGTRKTGCCSVDIEEIPEEEKQEESCCPCCGPVPSKEKDSEKASE